MPTSQKALARFLPSAVSDLATIKTTTVCLPMTIIEPQPYNEDDPYLLCNLIQLNCSNCRELARYFSEKGYGRRAIEQGEWQDGGWKPLHVIMSLCYGEGVLELVRYIVDTCPESVKQKDIAKKLPIQIMPDKKANTCKHNLEARFFLLKQYPELLQAAMLKDEQGIIGAIVNEFPELIDAESYVAILKAAMEKDNQGIVEAIVDLFPELLESLSYIATERKQHDILKMVQQKKTEAEESLKIARDLDEERRIEKERKKEFERQKEEILSQVPPEVKARFGEIYFSTFGKFIGPVLVMDPYKVEPGPIRDQWVEMFHKCQKAGKLAEMAHLTYWYGEFKDLRYAYTFQKTSKLISYENGIKKTEGKLNSLRQKHSSGKKLSGKDLKFLKGFEEMEADRPKDPRERHGYVDVPKERSNDGDDNAERPSKRPRTIDKDIAAGISQALRSWIEGVIEGMKKEKLGSKRKTFEGLSSNLLDLVIENQELYDEALGTIQDAIKKAKNKLNKKSKSKKKRTTANESAASGPEKSKKKRKLVRKRTKANKSAASESDAADKENHSVNKTIRADLLEAILGSPPPNSKINDKSKKVGAGPEDEAAASTSVAVDNGNRIEDCVKKEETEEMTDETTAPASVDN